MPPVTQPVLSPASRAAKAENERARPKAPAADPASNAPPPSERDVLAALMHDPAVRERAIAHAAERRAAAAAELDAAKTELIKLEAAIPPWDEQQRPIVEAGRRLEAAKAAVVQAQCELNEAHAKDSMECRIRDQRLEAARNRVVRAEAAVAEG